MALTLLPEEILEQIIENYDIKDLLACSAVCLEWRAKFNVDVFWKKFCIIENNEYLEKNDCTVRPIFVLPEYEERLQPLCRWRINLMKQIHLLNNWNCKRFCATEFRSFNGVVSCDLKVDCDGTHWLFVRTVSEIEIWNIQSAPQLLSTVPIFVNCLNINVFIAGNKALITQWNVVSVYDLRCSKESFKTEFRFVLEEESVLPVSFWTTTSKKDNRLVNEDDDFQFTNFGSLLVGLKQIPISKSDLLMHFWNVNTGEKLKTESVTDFLPDKHKVILTNIFKNDDIKGLIRLVTKCSSEDVTKCSSEDGSFSQMYLYDFTKQKLTNTYKMVPGVVDWCSCAHNILVTFSCQASAIKFYDYGSGELLTVKEIAKFTNSDHMQLIDYNFVYITFSCMTIIDIRTLEVVNCLYFRFHCNLGRITAIGPRFVVVWQEEYSRIPGSLSSAEVWDLKNLSKKLFQYSSNRRLQMVATSSSLVKQVITRNHKMCVYTFW